MRKLETLDLSKKCTWISGIGMFADNHDEPPYCSVFTMVVNQRTTTTIESPVSVLDQSIIDFLYWLSLYCRGYVTDWVTLKDLTRSNWLGWWNPVVISNPVTINIGCRRLPTNTDTSNQRCVRLRQELIGAVDLLPLRRLRYYKCSAFSWFILLVWPVFPINCDYINNNARSAGNKDQP